MSPFPSFIQKWKSQKPTDPKPLTVTVELSDGQWKTWKLGPGDGVGLGGYRIDVQGPMALLISEYSDDEIKAA